MERLREFQVVWKNRQLWIDVYTDYYRVTLPDGRELRMWRVKEGWKGFPELNITEELGRLIDTFEKK